MGGYPPIQALNTPARWEMSRRKLLECGTANNWTARSSNAAKMTGPARISLCGKSRSWKLDNNILEKGRKSKVSAYSYTSELICTSQDEKPADTRFWSCEAQRKNSYHIWVRLTLIWAHMIRISRISKSEILSWRRIRTNWLKFSDKSHNAYTIRSNYGSAL